MPFSRLLFFTALNIFNYLDRYLVSAVLPLIAAEFALSYEQRGFLGSAFVFGYFITSPIFGYLGDRHARPLLMFIGVFLWSCATLATGLAPGFYWFFAARVLVGVGEASFGTIAPGYVKDALGDPSRVNRAFALFYCAIPVGSALAYKVAGLMLPHYTWHAVFFVGAVPGIILSLLLLRVPEVRRAARETQPPIWSGVRQIAARPMLVLAILGYVLNAFSLNAIAFFIVDYATKRGFQVEEINNNFGIILVCAGFVGTMGGALLVDRLSRRARDKIRYMLRFVGLGSLIGVPFVATVFLTAHHPLFYVCCFIGQLVVFAGSAPINSVIVTICPPQFVTLTQGVTIFVMNLCGTLLAPILVGRVADSYGIELALQLSTVALFLSGALWVSASLLRSTPVPAQ